MSRAWRDYLENILVAVFLALFIRTFVITAYKVPTISMSPTLRAGDFILAYRLPFGIKIPFSSYKFAVGNPNRGEIVVFSFPDRPRVNYVKRIIGLPGDRIEIKSGVLWVNQEQVTDLSNPQGEGDFKIYSESLFGQDYSILLGDKQKREDFGPLIVPPDEVFVLGDNRDASDDSRYWGTVPINRIEARVVLIWLSLDWDKASTGSGLLDVLPRLRWQRVMNVPH